jgi:hypothetical protein
MYSVLCGSASLLWRYAAAAAATTVIPTAVRICRPQVANIAMNTGQLNNSQVRRFVAAATATVGASTAVVRHAKKSKTAELMAALRGSSIAVGIQQLSKRSYLR